MEVKKKTASKVIASKDIEEFERELDSALGRDDITILSLDYSCCTEPETEEVYFSALVVYYYTEPI